MSHYRFLITFASLFIFLLNRPAKALSFDEYFSQATQEFLHNNPDGAIEGFKAALQLNPHAPEAYFNCALAYLSKGNNQEAAIYLQKAIEHNPAYAKAHWHLGQLLHNDNNTAQALDHYNKAVTNGIHTTDIYCAIGKIYHQNKELDKALVSFTHALDNAQGADQPLLMTIANSLLNLGNDFFNVHKPEKALESYHVVLRISDQFSAIYHNIGFTLAEQLGNYQEAITAYEKSLRLKPDSVETHFCLSMAYLAVGKLKEGFAEYESRWQRAVRAPRDFTYPLANQWYHEDIAGKRVLVRVEQGLGDTLQFVRYARLLKDRGATVIVESQKPLTQLLSLCPYIDSVVTIGSPLPPFDLQTPMLNLPIHYGTTLDTVPAHVPYLFADTHLIEYWKHALATDKNFKIGICWRGDSAHSPAKFMPLEQFMHLAKLPGISIYSLQKVIGTEQLAQLPDADKIKQFGPDFDESHGRFMDTAAVIKNLDLVITVDTSIAHLAGGLGVATWIILPCPAEWRWLQERSDCPWYPTARLFRQQEYGNWQPVIGEIMEAVLETVNGK